MTNGCERGRKRRRWRKQGREKKGREDNRSNGRTRGEERKRERKSSFPPFTGIIIFFLTFCLYAFLRVKKSPPPFFPLPFVEVREKSRVFTAFLPLSLSLSFLARAECRGVKPEPGPINPSPFFLFFSSLILRTPKWICSFFGPRDLPFPSLRAFNWCQEVETSAHVFSCLLVRRGNYLESAAMSPNRWIGFFCFSFCPLYGKSLAIFSYSFH